MKIATFGRIAAIGLLAIANVACNEDITTGPEGGETNPGASDNATIVKERQANYKAISDSFKAIRAQMENGNPDYAAISDQADEINMRAQTSSRLLSVFVPTTPNPTSGFLLFFPEEDVIPLDMSIEDAAKLVISAGLVYPPHKPVEVLPDRAAE